MSFADEVNAAIAARESHKAELKQDLDSETVPSKPERAFHAEIRDLWANAEAHWNANNMVDADTAWWVEHGSRKPSVELKGQAPLVFGRVPTFVPGRSYAQWHHSVGGSSNHIHDFAATEHVTALPIGSWFALCAPGELREILPISADASNLRACVLAGHRWNYFQRPGVSHHGNDEYWAVTFESPGASPDIQLRCAPEGPTQIYVSHDLSWRLLGTLRQFVVDALAEKMARPKRV